MPPDTEHPRAVIVPATSAQGPIEITPAAPTVRSSASGPRRIRRMSTLLASQIAAGEVIERPASVVKELVENALDAGATRVTVDLEQGGVELVRVSDDGGGIPREDLPLALEPHATSKISTADDLDRIGTLGFRGEALASIASVARVSIRSRTREQPEAWVIDAEGSVSSEPRPAAGPLGTTITVRTLFFNTPARRKFLRTTATEQTRCMDVVRELAMGRPAVAFSVTCDGRAVLDLPPNQTPRSRAVAVMGKELEPELIEIHADEFDAPSRRAVGVSAVHPGASEASASNVIAVWGLVGKPSIARGSNKAQHYFLNGRAIRDRTVQHAVNEAFRGLIEPGRFPTAVVMIEMPLTAVDVNVHPAKAEVRFRDSSLVHSVVLGAVRRALRAADLTAGGFNTGFGGLGRSLGAGGGSVANGSSSPGAIPPWMDRAILPSSSGASGATGAGEMQAGARGAGRTSSESAEPSDPREAATRTAAFVDFFKRFTPTRTQEPISYQELRRSLDEGAAGASANPTMTPSSATDAPEPNSLAHGSVANTGADSSFIETNDAAEGSAIDSPRDRAIDPANPGTAVHSPDAETLPTPQARQRVLQVHSSYLVTQDDHGMLIIDQHALHERAMFEYLLSRVAERPLESQRLLTPSVVPCEPRQIDRLADLSGLLVRIGVAAEPIGPRSIGIHAFPTFLFDRGVDPVEFMLELFDKADAEDFAPDGEQALRDVLDMMSCKAAVKAGDRMSPDELEHLVRLRSEVERSSNCPHGRPTSIRITVRDLEKMFGRG